jgi:hypothetical protein
MSCRLADPLQHAGFSRVLCINLARRPDRWAQMQSRFHAQGIQGVERYPAKDGTELAIPPCWRFSAGAYG